MNLGVLVVLFSFPPGHVKANNSNFWFLNIMVEMLVIEHLSIQGHL